MELIFFVICVIVGGVVGAVIMWSVQRSNDQRRKFRADTISSRQKDLTMLYDELADKLERDPARLGIDVGKEYVTHRVQTVLNEVREEIE